MDPEGAGFLAETYTVFQLPDGMIVTQGTVSVQPTPPSFPTITHHTGTDSTAANDVVYGTGRYAGASGKARLLGGIDMSTTAETGEIGFNCVFVLELD
jgi:hypothetical protein